MKMADVTLKKKKKGFVQYSLYSTKLSHFIVWTVIPKLCSQFLLLNSKAVPSLPAQK